MSHEVHAWQPSDILSLPEYWEQTTTQRINHFQSMCINYMVRVTCNHNGC